jgi:hypothetical protein
LPKAPVERNSGQVLFTRRENFSRQNVTLPFNCYPASACQDHETGPGDTDSVPLLFLPVIFQYFFYRRITVELDQSAKMSDNIITGL